MQLRAAAGDPALDRSPDGVVTRDGRRRLVVIRAFEPYRPAFDRVRE
jgi:hypothetical protein